MAVTNEKSAQVTNQDANPPSMNPAYDSGGKVKIQMCEFTQGAAAGDATSTMLLCRIPAGQGRILKKLSVLTWSAFGASRTLDVGYSAHTKRDGTAVSAGVDILEDGRDVSAAGGAGVVLGAGTNADDAVVFTYDSKAPIDILATVAGGTIPAAATITGWIAYVPNE